MNPLRVNTALHIDSSAFMPKVDGHALRKRLMAPQAAPRKRVEPKEQVRIIYSRSAARQWASQHDEHVKDWREHLKLCRERPDAFLKRRCAEIGVSYQDVVKSGSRFKEHSVPRQMLMAELRCLYPTMSYPAIGKLFGRRDWTTVIHACRKHGIEAGERRFVADHHDKVKELFDQGFSDYAIGDAIGFTHVAVWAYRRKKGWLR